jgi:hypothetical protein
MEKYKELKDKYGEFKNFPSQEKKLEICFIAYKEDPYNTLYLEKLSDKIYLNLCSNIFLFLAVILKKNLKFFHKLSKYEFNYLMTMFIVLAVTNNEEKIKRNMSYYIF